MSVHAVGEPHAVADGVRLRLDPTRCDGVAICRHLAPDLVELDRWGYPLLADGRSSLALDGDELEQARKAAAACPHRALFVS